MRAGAVEKVLPKESVDWDAIYAAYLPRVYNFFRYRVGPGPQAEDLTAVTFEKAWRSRQKYRCDLAAFSTWLFTIARNVATDYLRRREPDLSLESVHGLASTDSPEEQAIKHADVERLALLLARLSPRQR
ncbi:MAG: sigma-70 family RNA polymerase sigma factor, partial [Rudaea sp.]